MTKCSGSGLSVTALNSNQLSGFGYDAAGNMTSNGGASYTYDAESRLKTTAGVTYTYDGDGQRVMKSSGTIYWGVGPTLESDLSGNLQREYIFAGGARIARRDISGGAVHYFLADRLGSTSVLVNSTGGIENQYDYLPYGGERDYSVTVTNQNYRFIGKERDSESGLDNFGARFDASSLGRFMTPDWADSPEAIPFAQQINPQSLNLYAYALNSPVTQADLDGHSADAAMTNSGIDVYGGEFDAEGQSWAGTLNYGAPAKTGPNCSSHSTARKKEQAQTHHKSDKNQNLLAKLIFGEATVIADPANEQKEMAAVAYSAVNRANYLKSHSRTKPSFFGARSRTLEGVIRGPGQYGSVGGPLWRAAGSPEKLNKTEAGMWALAKSTAAGVLAGTVSDPFADQGGTYGFRTHGSGSPGDSYVVFSPQIEGSENTFYGLSSDLH